MASYHVKQRGRLLDRKTQAVVERRSKELLGLALFAIGLAAAMVLGSYVPDDPSWLSVTAEPAMNLFGRFGASIASPLFIIVGWGAWGFALVPLVWGARFMLHLGSERAIGRVIFAPIAVALASVYASTHVPSHEWTHSFGLGGLFGDTVLGAVLGVVPVQAAFGLKVMALFVAFGAVGMGLFVLGFTFRELRLVARFMGIGFIMAYAHLMGLLGRGAQGVVRGAGGWRSRRAERVEERRLARAEAAALAAAEEEALAEQEAAYHAHGHAGLYAHPAHRGRVEADEPVGKPGLRLRIPGLIKRAPVVEKPHHEPPVTAADLDGPEGDDRIKAKIASVIKNRVRQPAAAVPHRAEPPVARHPRGPKPMILGEADRRPAELPRTAPVHADGPAPFVDLDAMDEMDMPEPELVAERLPEPQPEPRAVVQHTLRRPAVPSRKAKDEAQPKLQFEEPRIEYEIPPLALLASPAVVTRHHLSDEALEQNARMLESVLDDYGVKGEIVSGAPRPGGHDVRAGTRAGPEGQPRDRSGR